MHAVVGGEDRGAVGRKGKANQVVAGDHQLRVVVGGDAHDPTFTFQGSRNVQIAFHVEGQSLRTSQPTVIDRDLSARKDLVDGIETRGRGSGHIKVSAR